MDFSTLDLNLLKLFDALVQERSVTRAGLRLGLSQPAASRALGRLRRMLGDRLVERGPSGLALTPRGEALAGPVARWLEDARRIVAPPAFDPAAATGHLTVAAHDHLALLVLSALAERLGRLAPSMVLRIAPPAGDNVRQVEQGTVDLALGIFGALPGSLHRRALYDDRLACVVRSGHPAAVEALDLDRYLASRHAAVAITGVGESPVDDALARLGRTRHVALRIPSFLAAAMFVADSDMVLTLPGRLAATLARRLPLAVRALPLPVSR